ncbi:MAG: glutamate/tyrosine decarboxylase-like PLP-dependent enzyme [Planctomycetota bacterium]|jgi:glutamate/tyrosine decarboxylase-like PLP-dependent enzyme
MPSNYPERREIPEVLELVRAESAAYLASIDERLVRKPNAEAAAEEFHGSLPEQGVGAVNALRDLVDRGLDATVTSAGPRFFHYVIGGQTPASLGADSLAVALDQCAGTWVSSPLGVQLELIVIDWLRDLFELPEGMGGVLTTGATMANFCGLAAGRQWCGERMGHDIANEGLAGMEQIPVYSSGYLHAAATKPLAMLGFGRNAARRFTRDAVGRLDLEALENALSERNGKPAILVGNAGDVNAGDFDPIDAMADLAERYNSWLHVDGAFGLFARTTPESAPLAAGCERAHSLTVDAHKWMNVPYDCGISFVRDKEMLAKNFTLFADYLPAPDDPHPMMSNFSPESSRRARAFAIWSTLKAYGREGIRVMIEKHLALTRRLAQGVEAAPELELLAPAQLNIVCFRLFDENRSADEMDQINSALGEALLEDGRVFAGMTRYGGVTAMRPAIVNWRTRESDVDLLLQVVRELGAKLLAN